MMRNDNDRENLLPGMKPVLELLEREPERVDMVFVRKGRTGAESARLLDLCRIAGLSGRDYSGNNGIVSFQL